MPVITLPDQSQHKFTHALTVLEVAANIGARLAKDCIAGKVNDKLVDAAFLIEEDAVVSIITAKDPEGLEIIRHSTAHLLAHAVKKLFPSAQVTIGPVIEEGFYYDFAYKPGFTSEDLPRIEREMQALAAQDFPVTRQVIDRNEASALFQKMGEYYKAKIIETIPADESVSLYQQDDFIDLCRGPHVPSTAKLISFKLTKLAGAYWRGDSQNEMLQRIYGTAWPDKKSLKVYLTRLEEAQKRDHRKLGKQLNLFHFDPEATGMVFWHPNGWQTYLQVQQYIRRHYQQNGYQEISTPQLISRKLLERSGHWGKFGEGGIFTINSEHHKYVMRPMNCPCHVQVYKQKITSYRELPIRLAEFGSCYRNEPSGTLHGLMRVRNLVQDDGHIFCTAEQIQAEVATFIDQVYQVYADFGFSQVLVKLATRPVERVGSDAIWDKAEEALQAALQEKRINFELSPEEGAFYGPKIEFSLKDCIGRVWQCGTIQLDFYVPNRLGATYIAEDGNKQAPVMLHRAILGSLERFIGILLEDTAGILPVWLAPVQAVLLNITDQQAEYTQKVAEKLKKMEFRVKLDLRNEKIGFKIREYTLQRIPYLLVIGKREVETETLAVRTQAGQDLGAMTLNTFVQRLQQDIARYSRLNTSGIAH